MQLRRSGKLSFYLFVGLIYLQHCLFSSTEGNADHERRFQTRKAGQVKLYSFAKELFVDGKLILLNNTLNCDNITGLGKSGSDSNPGTEIQPFKSITHARDAIREMKQSTGIPSSA